MERCDQDSWYRCVNPMQGQRDGEEPIADPGAVRSAYISLIVDIMYHAIKDRRESDESFSSFADDDHAKFCIRNGFRSGQQELEFFANSPWFERLCDELEHTNRKDIKDILVGYCAHKKT